MADHRFEHVEWQGVDSGFLLMLVGMKMVIIQLLLLLRRRRRRRRRRGGGGGDGGGVVERLEAVLCSQGAKEKPKG
jgi:hypothetical protein